MRSDLAADRSKLLEAREKRVPPSKDTKILTSWNGLMLARIGRRVASILGEPRYAEAAEQTAGFLLDQPPDAPMAGSSDSYKDGQAKFNAYLDDYANLIDGLTRLVRGHRDTLDGSSRPWSLPGIMIDEFHDAARRWLLLHRPRVTSP